MYLYNQFIMNIRNDINTLLCPSKNNSDTIKLTLHTSCYWGRRLTLCYFNFLLKRAVLYQSLETRPKQVLFFQRLRTVLQLWMSMEQIFARSGRTFPGTDRLLHLLQLDPHVVDVSVHGDQVHVLLLQQKQDWLTPVSWARQFVLI